MTNLFDRAVTTGWLFSGIPMRLADGRTQSSGAVRRLSYVKLGASSAHAHVRIGGLGAPPKSVATVATTEGSNLSPMMTALSEAPGCDTVYISVYKNRALGDQRGLSRSGVSGTTAGLSKIAS